MKILIFSPYYPPHIGGLETHADEFNKYMSSHVEKIVVFTPRLPFDASEKEIRFENVEIIRFPAFEIISNYPLPKFWKTEFWKLFFRLYKQDFNVIISRTRFFFTSLLALFYAKTRRIKWIHIEHGSDFVKLHSKATSFLAWAYDHFFGRLVLTLSDQNIANSIASAQFCQKISFGRKCEVIYRGVEIEKIESIVPNLELKKKYENKTIITFIGRLIDGKGVHDLLEAVKDLQEDFILFIVGDGPQKENLKKLTEKYTINEKIIFFGQKKFEESIAILKISDIFVNPSYTEGLPTSVIEAGLCEKAIIATNVGGTPEIFENKKEGFLIEPRKPNELKSILKVLIENNKLRRNISVSIKKQLLDKFDWNKNIKKYKDIISI